MTQHIAPPLSVRPDVAALQQDAIDQLVSKVMPDGEVIYIQLPDNLGVVPADVFHNLMDRVSRPGKLVADIDRTFYAPTPDALRSFVDEYVGQLPAGAYANGEAAESALIAAMTDRGDDRLELLLRGHVIDKPDVLRDLLTPYMLS